MEYMTQPRKNMPKLIVLRDPKIALLSHSLLIWVCLSTFGYNRNQSKTFRNLWNSSMHGEYIMVDVKIGRQMTWLSSIGYNQLTVYTVAATKKLWYTLAWSFSDRKSAKWESFSFVEDFFSVSSLSYVSLQSVLHFVSSH